MNFLVIASCFAPKNVIGAVRITKLVKYLIRSGHEVTVISPELEDYDTIDTTLECPELEKVTRITVPYSSLTTSLTRANKSEAGRQSTSDAGNQTNKSLKGRLYQIARNAFATWRDYEWLKKAKKVISQLNKRFDVVLSSYPNVSAHDAAWYAKKNGIAKIWVADFRDPIVFDGSDNREQGKCFKKQANIVKRSDLTTFVSKKGTEQFACYQSDRYKVRWITNGFDLDDFSNILEENVKDISLSLPVVFSYAGGMYKGERDCSPLFQSIRELIDEKKITKGDVKVEYAGRDIGILTKQAEKYKLNDIVVDNGFIARPDSIRMQLHSDCVIVATDCYIDYGGAMTGKIYEPIMMKKPIVLLVNGDGKHSEPAEFVNKLHAGVVYEKGTDGDDISVLKRAVFEYVKLKSEGKPILSTIINDERDKYNYESIVRTLVEEIAQIYSKPGSKGRVL